MDWAEYFGEPISVYTDAQALEDGVLVDIARLDLAFEGRVINRVTQNLWRDLEQDCRSEAGINVEAIASALRAKCRMASFHGGVWTLPPEMWLIENEVGGWTLMYPSDY